MSKTKVKSLLKNISLIFICLLLFTSLAVSQDFSGLYKDLSPSVVIVIAYDSKNSPISQGSGFFINEDGDIITNFHVVKGSDRIEVVTSDGKRYPVKDPLDADVDGDLFLASTDIQKNMVHPLKISSAIPEIGEDIIVIGCPEGLSQTMTRGTISAIRDQEKYGTVIQIDAAISPGSSGSPVINKKGEVIGVATFHRIEGQNLNFAISGKNVSDFIGKTGTISKVNSSDFWLNKGVALSSLGKYEESILAYDESIRLDPNRANGSYSKGISLYYLGKYEEAIDAYDEAIRINPNHTRALSMKGTALRDQGKYDEAIKTYDEAIRLDPNDAFSWSNKGTAFADQGRLDEALKACDEAIRIDPKFAGAWFNKGVYLYNQGKLDEAIKASKESLGLDPNYAEAWFNEGNILFGLGKYDEAIMSYDETIKLDPNDADAWNGKGIALGKQGNYDEAINCFDEIIRLAPNLAYVWSNKGTALKLLGRTTEANAAFAKAKELE